MGRLTMSTKAALFLLGPALVACRTTEHPASLHNGDWGTRDTLGYCESNFHAELSRDKIACKSLTAADYKGINEGNCLKVDCCWDPRAVAAGGVACFERTSFKDKEAYEKKTGQ